VGLAQNLTGHGCVENVVFQNIKMVSQQCGCRVKSYSSTEGDGSVRNISWVNITMENVSSCVSVNDM
jgi:polygalacturonase